MIGFSLSYWRRKIYNDIIMVRILIKEKIWTPFIIIFNNGKRPEI